MSMELSGPEASRKYIEAAHPEHPSLLDPEHQLAALFGVVNIPNVIWINEAGTIVRPPEPGWPDEKTHMPRELFKALPQMGRAHTAPTRSTPAPDRLEMLSSGQNRAAYVSALRDWAANGESSVHALSADEVVARSQPRSENESRGAAHFELANQLWRDATAAVDAKVPQPSEEREGQRELSIAHFNHCHRLQPDNWTYKRQAWSLVGHERIGGEVGRWVQAPVAGEEESWPFASDFSSDVAMLEAGQYYPATL